MESARLHQADVLVCIVQTLRRLLHEIAQKEGLVDPEDIDRILLPREAVRLEQCACVCAWAGGVRM